MDRVVPAIGLRCSVMSSDHFSPWSERHGRQAAWLGGAVG
jgi:hypothetical protein